jgi:hypothetical protein
VWRVRWRARASGPACTASSSLAAKAWIGGTIPPSAQASRVPVGQVSKLVNDKVELAQRDLFDWLHHLCVITEVEDDTHLKHIMNLYAKAPYLTRQLSKEFSSVIPRK